MSQPGGYIGRPERQRESERLVGGHGRFAVDHRPPGLCYMAVSRSPFGHARLGSIDLDRARSMSGVLGAWALADLPFLAGGMGDAPPFPDLAVVGRPVLAGDLVRYFGEPVAIVAADDPYLAVDAVEAVRPEFEPLAATADVIAAAAPGAPRIHDTIPSNVAGRLRRGFGDAAAAFGGAPVVVSRSFRLAQVAGGYLEPRCVTAWFSHPDGVPTIWTSTQWTFSVRECLARLLGLPPEGVRVLAPDVGGAFGAKGMAYPEEVLAMAASQALGRPVRWTATRSEDTATTAHGHGTAMELTLAAGRDGSLRGLRGRVRHSLGAYVARTPYQVDNIAGHLVNAYRLPALEVDVELVYTNSVPAGFVRGGGREIGNFAIERLMDALAHELGTDPAELRRRNLIQASQMPHDTGLRRGSAAVVYDGGDYPRLLTMALDRIGYEDLRRRQGAGEPVGVGVACLVESTGIGMAEPSTMSLAADGRVRVGVGTTPGGQGHETAAAQVAADRLGWPFELISVASGDTSLVPFSANTSASRSAVEMGNSVAITARSMRERLLALASQALEADAADLEVSPAGAWVRGVPGRVIPLATLIGAAGLEVAELYQPDGRRAHASGCHAAVVRLDLETGAVSLDRYVIAHDIGRVINPRLAEAQTHGAFAHGLGYALFEEATYDGDGNLAGTFLDYQIPGAPELAVPPETLELETPASSNPEGFRGAGEGGTIPVPAAMAAAIEDCARRMGVELSITDLPITPGRLFEARAGR